MAETFWYQFRYPKGSAISHVLPCTSFKKLETLQAVEQANEMGAIAEKVSDILSIVLDSIGENGRLIVATFIP